MIDLGQPIQKHIAMWASIRSLTTAMMRAWGSRPDTLVWDDPLYPVYLSLSGKQHPYYDEILMRYETNFDKVVTLMTGKIPYNKTILFQKHIADVLLFEQMNMNFLGKLMNFLLIRNPHDIIHSISNKLPVFSLHDTGLPNLQKLFDLLHHLTGETPIIIDAYDLQQYPKKTLTILCQVLNVEFTDAMLSWSNCRYETDGLWGSHWYDNVINSTGFHPYKNKEKDIPKHLHDIFEQANSIYQNLYNYRLTINKS